MASPSPLPQTLLAEGELFNASGQDFVISYASGDGNDITLAAVPEPGSAMLLIGGLLAVAGLRRPGRRA